jgi:phosphoribosyl 1,2-cyclic phosphodiesterase
VRVKFWGVRGSIPVPGPAVERYGGNTSCVQVTGEDGREIILDAGTGIRALGAALAGRCRTADILLTHLHIDHVQGLLFFAPLFETDAEITVWGPPAYGHALRERVARYLSSPLAPIELRDLPGQVRFRDVPTEPWRIGGVEITPSLVLHNGPTLGYRLRENGASCCYLPDHEPGLGGDLKRAAPEWISGHELARGASLLIHDAQYSDREYEKHRGWGHSSFTDALTFAKRSEAEHVVLFHHDPDHDDARVDEIGAEARQEWAALGNGASIEMAREGCVFEL